MSDSLEERIKRHGLERIAEQLKASVRQCVRLKAQPTKEEELPPAASKLGGFPDLPRGVEWPQSSGEPLSFIAQINTRALPYCEADLPADTLLSFFYDAADFPGGYHPDHRGSWRILATPLNSSFERRRYPQQLKKEAQFRACLFTATKDISLPHVEADFIAQWQMTRKEDDAYLELYEALMPGEKAGLNHQLLGHSNSIQGDMQLLCHLVSQGVDCGEYTALKQPASAGTGRRRCRVAPVAPDRLGRGCENGLDRRRTVIFLDSRYFAEGACIR